MMIIFFLMKRISCISTLYACQSQTVTAVYYQEVFQKNYRPFQKKILSQERLKKFFCITTMFVYMLHTLTSNFWRNEASKLFHTLHIAQTSPHVTSGYSQKLKKACVEWGLNQISMWIKLRWRDVKRWVKMDCHLSSKSGRNVGSSVLHWRFGKNHVNLDE